MHGSGGWPALTLVLTFMASSFLVGLGSLELRGSDAWRQRLGIETGLDVSLDLHGFLLSWLSV
jgi:hypothetical protein